MIASLLALGLLLVLAGHMRRALAARAAPRTGELIHGRFLFDHGLGGALYQREARDASRRR